jgi:hypothetical protein
MGKEPQGPLAVGGLALLAIAAQFGLKTGSGGGVGGRFRTGHGEAPTGG